MVGDFHLVQCLCWDLTPASHRSAHLLSQTLDDPRSLSLESPEYSFPPASSAYKRLSLQDILASSTDEEEGDDPELTYLKKTADR